MTEELGGSELLPQMGGPLIHLTNLILSSPPLLPPLLLSLSLSLLPLPVPSPSPCPFLSPVSCATRRHKIPLRFNLPDSHDRYTTVLHQSKSTAFLSPSTFPRSRNEYPAHLLHHTVGPTMSLHRIAAVPSSIFLHLNPHVSCIWKYLHIFHISYLENSKCFNLPWSVYRAPS